MPRSRLLRLGVLLIAVVAGVWLWRSFMRDVPPPAAPLVQSSKAPPAQVQVRPRVFSPESLEPEADGQPGERNVARPEGGTGENQLEHMFRSIVEANAAELSLTPAEIDRLTADYLEYQEIHAELVTRYLQETSFDPASVTLRLPPYPVEGKLLRDMFYRRLGTDFAAEKTAQINEQLGGFFDHAFRGFGITEQSFTVSRSADVPNAFEVQWQAKLPEGQRAANVNPAVNFPGSSGTLLLYREQVESGEFRFLGAVVNRRFPDASAQAAAP